MFVNDKRNEIKSLLEEGSINIDEAIKRLRKLNSKNPSDNIRLDIGVLEFKRGNANKARQIFEKLLNSPYIADFARLNLSRIDESEDKLDDAKSNLDQVKRQKLMPQVHHIKGKVEKKLGNHTAARSNFISDYRNSKDPRAVVNIALAELQDNRLDEFWKYYQILMYSGNNIYADKLMAYFYNKNGDYKKAVEYFKKLVDTSLRNDAYLNLASINIQESNYNLALEYLEPLYNTSYRNSALMCTARILEKEGFNEESVELLDSLESQINDDFVYIHKSQSLCSLGRYDEAREYLKKIKDKSIKDIAIRYDIYIDIYENKPYDGLKKLEFISSPISYTKNFLMFYLYYNSVPNATFDIEELSYACKQAYKYKSKRAIQHIESHLSEDEDKVIHTVFKDGVDIKNLYFEAREKIQHMNYTTREFVEEYIIKFDYVVGEEEGIETYYAKAVVVPGTKNIITMYPVYVTEKYRLFTENNITRKLSL